MYCKECGTKVENGVQEACVNCGCTNFIEKSNDDCSVIESEKSRLVALLLWAFIGGFGAHHYYIGNTKKGTLILVLTLCGFITFGLTSIASFVLIVIDIINLLTGKFLDLEGKPVLRWNM